MSLHVNSKERIRRDIEFALEDETIGWRHPLTDEWVEKDLDVDVRRKSQPDSKQYPQVVLEFSPDGVPQQRMDLSGNESDHEVRFPRPDSDEIAYERYVGTPMYSVLNVVVVMNRDADPIPKHVIADQIAHKVYSHLLFDTQHLNDQGTTADGEPVDYEWPLHITSRRGDTGGIIPNDGMLDEQPVARRTFAVRVEYFFWRDEDVPQLKALEYTLEIDRTGDGETDVTYGPEWVPEGVYDPEYGDSAIAGVATISASPSVDSTE